MKRLIAAIALSVGLFATTNTTSAQHPGNPHGYGNHQGYGDSYGGYNYFPGRYVAPRFGSYSLSGYGGHPQQGYDAHIYTRPLRSAPFQGGAYSVQGYPGHGTHYDRHGHR